MNVQQSFNSGKDGKSERVSGWTDLPPAQAGLAAALQRAYELPAVESERLFADLLSQLN